MKFDADTKATVASLDKLIKAKSKAVQRALVVNGLDLVQAIKIDLNRHASRFKEYKRGTNTHWSSRPGQPPNSDTGWLARTVTLSKKRVEGSVFVIIAARYARKLEFGIGMKARPFVKPARDAKESRFRDRILKAMNNA